MEIKQVPINELQPASYNPRKLTEDQAKQLEESIRKFGMVDPIIANKRAGRENIVVGGHQRLNIAKLIGMETVPVFYVDLDEEAERELNIRLNKNLGQWDFDKLANEFDVDMLLSVGFSKSELGLLESDKDNVNAVDDRLDSLLESDFRQIVLFYDPETFERVIDVLKEIGKVHQLDSNADAVLKLIEIYEGTESSKEGDKHEGLEAPSGQ